MNDTITTELRESMVDDACGLLYIGETALADLCDAIDAVHANLEAENESLRRELDRVLGEQEDRDGLVRLPKDADGEYIHIGDVMQMLDDNELREVVGFYEEGFLAWLNGMYVPCNARFYSHHHAPTVEDVLREFAMEVCGEPALTIRSGVVEEYASRLRLAGEA